VEITDDFVDKNASSNSAALLALSIQVFGVVFPFTLLYTLASAK
jgi:hypothetical protein